ncbi:hypothetical protein B0T19DRAFT_53335 [Cercophora scortea]|uniref:Uncharacterized protein n=1 Tax=Cercophora scortea TaxID=314031 RepID=A0AAE0J4N9_9PEZI|nr:hypothetical protein B0T19DRAFT_53335 [Cercophora scortea]
MHILISHLPLALGIHLRCSLARRARLDTCPNKQPQKKQWFLTRPSFTLRRTKKLRSISQPTRAARSQRHARPRSLTHSGCLAGASKSTSLDGGCRRAAACMRPAGRPDPELEFWLHRAAATRLDSRTRCIQRRLDRTASFLISSRLPPPLFLVEGVCDVENTSDDRHHGDAVDIVASPFPPLLYKTDAE